MTYPKLQKKHGPNLEPDLRQRITTPACSTHYASNLSSVKAIPIARSGCRVPQEIRLWDIAFLSYPLSLRIQQHYCLRSLRQLLLDSSRQPSTSRTIHYVRCPGDYDQQPGRSPVHHTLLNNLCTNRAESEHNICDDYPRYPITVRPKGATYAWGQPKEMRKSEQCWWSGVWNWSQERYTRVQDQES